VHPLLCQPENSSVFAPNDSTTLEVKHTNQSANAAPVNEGWSDGLRSCSDALDLQCALNLVEYHRIVDARRHGPRSAVSDPFHGAAEDLARARLRQSGDGDRQVEGCDRRDILPNEADAFLLDLGGGSVQ